MGCRRNSTKSYRVLCLKTGTVSSVNFFKANWPEVICRVLFWMPCLSALGPRTRIRGASKEICGDPDANVEKQVRRVVVRGHLWWMTTWHQDGSGRLRDVRTYKPRLKWSKWCDERLGEDLLRIDVKMEKSGWDAGWLKLFLEIFTEMESWRIRDWSNGGSSTRLAAVMLENFAVKTRGRFVRNLSCGFNYNPLESPWFVGNLIYRCNLYSSWWCKGSDLPKPGIGEFIGGYRFL